jgi:hypothetical protein
LCFFVRAAVTKLTLGEYNMLRQDHVLPPNLLQLAADNAESASCLLPLTKLQDLDLRIIEQDAIPAASCSCFRA